MANRFGNGTYSPPRRREFHHRRPPDALHHHFDPPEFYPPVHYHRRPPPPPPPPPPRFERFEPFPLRDMFIDRERERERIRDEILREETRRRIIEEEVRLEIQMERRYRLEQFVRFNQSRQRDGHENTNGVDANVNGPFSLNFVLPPAINQEERKSQEKSLPEAISDDDIVENKTVAEINDQSEKKAETSGSKRKASPAKEQEKKKKNPAKEFNCEICQLTITGESSWMGHLNGKKHRRQVQNGGTGTTSVPDSKETLEENDSNKKLEILEENDLKKKLSSEKDGVSPSKTKKKKIAVEEGEKKYRFWCEPCGFGCNTTIIMEIHFSSNSHKVNCEKESNES